MITISSSGQSLVRTYAYEVSNVVFWLKCSSYRSLRDYPNLEISDYRENHVELVLWWIINEAIFYNSLWPSSGNQLTVLLLLSMSEYVCEWHLRFVWYVLSVLCVDLNPVYWQCFTLSVLSLSSNMDFLDPS